MRLLQVFVSTGVWCQGVSEEGVFIFSHCGLLSGVERAFETAEAFGLEKSELESWIRDSEEVVIAVELLSTVSWSWRGGDLGVS